MSLMQTKNDRREYMKEYHKERQENDPKYREMKRRNAREHYEKKNMSEYEIWYYTFIKEREYHWKHILVPKYLEEARINKEHQMLK